jgi:ketol-acid reductoisomerase
MNERLQAATVAILGFGNQGEAQALNLRANGVRVVVGARTGRPGAERARSHGFAVSSLDEAVRKAGVVALLLPDEMIPELWADVRAALPPGAGVVFAHGFALLYQRLDFPPDSDVVLVSPAGPGRVLKRGDSGSRLAAYLAVHRDATGAAWELAEAYGRALGCDPLWRTTVREETEVDLFGEQVVLCGGMIALVRAAFEALVERGYAPEIAYLECVHQLKFLADLLHERGLHGFHQAISATALYGGLTRGPRVIGEPSRREMRAILDEIRNGSFAREWLAEVRDGRHRLDALAATAARDPLNEARARALGMDPEQEA